MYDRGLSDTHPEARRAQIDLLRKASVAKRLSIMLSLSHTARFLSRRGIQRANPDLSKREVDLRFAELHYGKDLAEKLRTYLTERES